MIQDVDRTLEQLLRNEVPLRDEHISFAVPNETFVSSLPGGLTVNLYLYDLSENHELRRPEWRAERTPEERTRKLPPWARIDLFYLITAWSKATPPEVLAEHALLSRILATLLRFPALPASALQGALVGHELPLGALAAQPHGLRNPAEFWGALRVPPRPGIQLVITMPIAPAALSDQSQEMPPAISFDLAAGLAGGRLYHLEARPSLTRLYQAGVALRRLAITTAPAARLQQAVIAERERLRIIQVGQLAAHEWVLIDDPANPEFVRLGEIPGPGEQEVTVTPPLRFTHNPADNNPIPLRPTTAPEQTAVTTILVQPVAAEAVTLQVADRTKVAPNDVLLIADGDETEVVQVTAVTPGTGAGAIQVRPALRFAHRANRNLYRRLLTEPPANPANATRLAQPVAQPGSPIILDSAVGPGGTLLMVGAGPQVEFCRLEAAATAGTPVVVSPPLRHSHPANTPLRRLAGAEVVGQLHLPAAAGAAKVVMVGDSGAIDSARRQARALVSAGEMLQLADPAQPAAFQVAKVTEEWGALAGPPDSLVTIGGWVADSASPAQAIAGAQVSLLELNLAATSDAEGKFTFANLAYGAYTLAVTAPAYQAAQKVVQVPARAVNEYQIILGP
jgi:hypothetical protein